ncbi:MAG TPA: hypothetical protein VF054_21190 [Micromonosporaceae bacterium]
MEHDEAVRRARQAAEACRKAAEDLVSFAERMSGRPGMAEIAEYDALVAREAAAQSERRDAFAELGLTVPSVDGETGDIVTGGGQSGEIVS